MSLGSAVLIPRYEPPVNPTPAPAVLPERSNRNAAIDALRGVVMVLMALDHTRDYFGPVRNGVPLAQTSLGFFFTRWITHFCAPTFVFLAGVAAYLSLARGKTRAELSRFLLKRGLLLVLLELTVVRFAWTFNFDYRVVWVQVIWALGWSMIVVGALLRFRDAVMLAFGLALVFGHDLLDGLQLHHQAPTLFGAGGRDWLLAILHIQRPPIAYPLVPWLGVMALGFCFGRVMVQPEALRRRLCFRIGLGALGLFVLLRLSGLYGEPTAWVHDQGLGRALLSFLDCSKYPPSLCYLLMTLGPAIAVLPLLERGRGAALDFLAVLGRVPLFYYLAHIVLIHAAAVAAGMLMGFRFSQMCVPFFMLPPQFRSSLAVVYPIWIAVVAALYLPCRRLADLKARTRSPWLSYL
jgi:uncharacterized membrane protein